MLLSPLPFGKRRGQLPRDRPFALNLLFLWSYLPSAESAHADIPAHAEPVSSKLHQESFRANTVKEHDELQRCQKTTSQ